ncbi:hypothetical protein BKA70DRAFT_1422561 [Coprinopsis sp. MPI-PUGE-AT-0042]|nr:hypothetical protein BKA70DRAFT_1422561 [Coprinopsis sp. MPI-PUGE-AT-0042]
MSAQFTPGSQPFVPRCNRKAASPTASKSLSGAFEPEVVGLNPSGSEVQKDSISGTSTAATLPSSAQTESGTQRGTASNRCHAELQAPRSPRIITALGATVETNHSWERLLSSLLVPGPDETSKALSIAKKPTLLTLRITEIPGDAPAAEPLQGIVRPLLRARGTQDIL